MRDPASRPTWLVVIVIISCWRGTIADSVLGFAVMAGLSHQLNILRIGQELAARGHNFSMLLSSTDSIGVDAVNKRSFPGLQLVSFDGPQGVGTEEWASGLSRDPQEVQHSCLSYAVLRSPKHPSISCVRRHAGLQSFADAN